MFCEAEKFNTGEKIFLSADRPLWPVKAEVIYCAGVRCRRDVCVSAFTDLMAVQTRCCASHLVPFLHACASPVSSSFTGELLVFVFLRTMTQRSSGAAVGDGPFE